MVNITHRIETLEINQVEIKTTQIKILDVLEKIEKRLIGNIEEDTPGIVDDMRALRRSMESIDIRLISMERANVQGRVDALEQNLKITNEKVEELNKYRFVLYGGIAVAVFLLTKAWEYLIGKK